MTLKKNDDIRLEITTLTNQGSGLGRYNDEVVFVDSAVPGDVLDVHIIKVSKNYAIGKINKVIKASKSRIISDCEVSTRCGGCAYRHMAYEAELQEKKKYVGDVLERIGGVKVKPEEILSIETPDAYRNKALIPVGMDEKGNIVTGFYSRKTHRIIDCDNCLLQMKEFSPIIKAVRKYICSNPVTIYDESTHKGLIRHIYLRRGRNTGDIMVCLVINGDNIPSKQKLIDILRETDSNIKSIALCVNREKTNVVLGSRTITIWGEDTIEDVLCGLKFRISPLSFYQVNPEGTELLYNRAKQYAELKDGDVLLDMYCGAGTIGLSMSDKAKEIIGVEIIPEAIENAKENAKLNGIENTRFICDDASGAAKTLLSEGIKPDVVVLDPPRKGCSIDVIRAVSEMSPERIVYVSCDAASLARDCALFFEEGYEVTKVTAVDMFPRTIHVETVVQLVRKNPDTHIDFEINLDEFDLTASEAKATYHEIKDYVLDKFGLKVSTLYISQVKAKCGIIERENYNKGEGKSKVPQCPPEKEKAIINALKHFKMI